MKEGPRCCPLASSADWLLLVNVLLCDRAKLLVSEQAKLGIGWLSICRSFELGPRGSSNTCRRYYLSLMYVGLRTSNALHKTMCCINWCHADRPRIPLKRTSALRRFRKFALSRILGRRSTSSQEISKKGQKDVRPLRFHREF